jgi:hypothetical protein
MANKIKADVDKIKADVDEEGFNFLGEKVKDVSTNAVSSFASQPSLYEKLMANKIKAGETGLFGMKNSTVSGLADIGGLGVSAFLAYDDYKTSKLDRKQTRLAIAGEEQKQANYNSSRAGFNAFT